MNFSVEEQKAFIQEQRKNLLHFNGNIFNAAGVLSSAIIFLGLLPIFTFLLLFYKNVLMNFIFLWFPEKNHLEIREAAHEIELMIQSYLIGLLIQITYIIVLSGSTLLIFGIKHALLIGIIFAILNIIPYIGAILGNLIGVLLILSSSHELWDALTVLLVIATVHFLDTNILMPRIVGSKVKNKSPGCFDRCFYRRNISRHCRYVFITSGHSCLKKLFLTGQRILNNGVFYLDMKGHRKKLMKGY